MNVIIKYGAAYEQPTSIVTGGSPRLVAAMADMKDTSRTGKSNRHENISTGLLNWFAQTARTVCHAAGRVPAHMTALSQVRWEVRQVCYISLSASGMDAPWVDALDALSLGSSYAVKRVCVGRWVEGGSVCTAAHTLRVYSTSVS